MKRRIICTLLTILLVFSALPASSAASISENKPRLSEMSETECIAFVKECGIELPTIYDDEAEWGPFVKGTITLFENNPDAPITTSYTVTAKLAKEIRNAVNDYYGITSTYAGQRMLNAYTASSTGLLYSTVYAEWDPDFEKYNCYSYALGITNAWFDPGLITAISKNPSCIESWDLDIENITIEEIRDAVIQDLGTRGETRIIFEESAMDTSNLCTNESVICVRKGNKDYHFMRYTADGWLHKPSNTQILKYNSVPTDGVIWTNEAVYMGSYYEATIEYDSTIYFISYNGHDWEYTNNGDGTHTKSCSICGDVFTKNCDLEYTNLTNGRHGVACTICDYYVNSQPCTHTYTSNEDKTHTVTCTLCGNSYSNNCGFTSTYIGEDRHRRECSRCGHTYTEDCYLENTYCGDETNDHVHRKACRTCDRGLEATEACVFAYKSNGENTHVYACTQCRYVKLGPSPCAFKSDGRCRFCGALENSAVINRQEEVILQD